MVSGGIAHKGLPRHYFVFGGTLKTYNYDCVCDGSATFGMPQRRYEEVTVPGRDGKLYYSGEQFDNTEIKFNMFFLKMHEFEDFKNLLLSFRGYQRLEDSHHPGEYRLAMLNSVPEPEVSGYDNEYCTVEVTFTVKPQRFLLTGEQEKTITDTNTGLYNPTLYSSKPIIKVFLTGSSGEFTLNKARVQLHGVSALHQYIQLDSETQNASSVLTDNCNSLITAPEFPVLVPGNNLVSSMTGINKLIFTPRWWKI